MADAETEPVSETPSPKKGLTYLEKWALVGSVLVIIVIIGVVALVSYSPNNTTTSTTAPTPPAPQPTWHAATKDSDTSDSVVDTVTNTFYINGTRFRIQWQYTTQSPQYSAFGFYVYQRGEATPVDIWCQSGSSDPNFASCDYSANTIANGMKTCSGPGYFQVRVFHANTDWSIAV